MTNLIKINFLLFFSFFPVFVFRSNFSFNEILLSIIVLLLPLLVANCFYYHLFKNNKILINLSVALIFVLGVDNNLGLWSGLIEPYSTFIFTYFKTIYFSTLIFLIILFLIFFLLIQFNGAKIINIFLVFLITIFIFNIFDKTKSHKNIIEFEKNVKLQYLDTEVIIIFDEMSGLNSLSSTTEEGQNFNMNFKNLLKEYNFEFYSNIKSISKETRTSIPNLLNFSNDMNIRHKHVKNSKVYFTEFELNKNLFFEKYNQISVFQNMYLNYCKSEAVYKCETYNPFKKSEFTKGYKDNYLSKIISIWKLNGSILSTFVWRSLRELRIIDSILEPEGEKIKVNSLFENIKNDIYSKKFDLIFVHTLIPHRPYGFNKNCNYNGRLSLNNNYYSEIKHLSQHNVERNCVIFFLEKFLNDLDKKKFLNKINLTILSDHGSRINSNENSSLSSIYASRSINSKYKEISDPSILHSVFSDNFKNPN
jgi:hypothetical protein